VKVLLSTNAKTPLVIPGFRRVSLACNPVRTSRSVGAHGGAVLYLDDENAAGWRPAVVRQGAGGHHADSGVPRLVEMDAMGRVTRGIALRREQIAVV
jgi:hypothetical protein